ncbi:hypothetical protein [Microcoleus vaginatus]|uniref:hypothetical protein n=1 Tax=Microcoleus vaginatus TaxID=119532 RepID=UPI00020D2677|nr:hypothetical protein MicvaDRAFT_0747 [Microcoleus vaginatus FGP-2]
METWFLCFNTKQVVATVLKRAERAGKLNNINSGNTGMMESAEWGVGSGRMWNY